MVNKQRKVQHLFLRAGFGESPLNIQKLTQQPIDQLVNGLFEHSAAVNDLLTLKNPVRGKEASNFKIALMLLRSREQVKSLNLAWLAKMPSEPAQLREKMTLFWHGHFATKVPFAYLMQKQNNTLRKYALGSFRNLLHAVAKDPAMLIFLNNHQNRKRSPNENFARELMELFTLGEGQYTEKDIKEAARAFTGWQVDKGGKFYFNARQHDFGYKTVFGKTGDWNGDDIIDIILNTPKTAEFITRKVYAYMVNDSVNEDHVKQLSKLFFESDYNIEALLKAIFISDWFYASDNVGTKICSPIELIIRYRRLFNLELKEDKQWLQAQKVLGQSVFNPPNVAGWPGGRNWIDSSSLLFRMNLAPLLFEYDRATKWSNNTSDWTAVYPVFEGISQDKMIAGVLNSFLQTNALNKGNLIKKYSQEDRIESAVLRTMMLPEFQLI
ncbi:MAG: DUF1800 domain-containing protein [Bacteroidota bacterium]